MLAGEDGDSAVSLDEELRLVDEQPRLDELRRYDLEGDVADAALDRLAELAARVCHAPMGVISAIDDRYQRFLARWGVPSEVGDEIPKRQSICASAIAHPDSLLVLEELTRSRYAQLPIVTALGLTFYAGAPLVTPSGYALGTVCVVDRRQRTCDAGEARGLSLVRDQIMEVLEARRELGELHRSEALRQEAVEALVATQRDLSHRIELRTRDIAAAHRKTRELLERIGDGYVVARSRLDLRLRQCARRAAVRAHAGRAHRQAHLDRVSRRRRRALPRRVGAGDARAGRGHARGVLPAGPALVREPHLSDGGERRHLLHRGHRATARRARGGARAPPAGRGAARGTRGQLGMGRRLEPGDLVRRALSHLRRADRRDARRVRRLLVARASRRSRADEEDHRGRGRAWGAVHLQSSHRAHRRIGAHAAHARRGHRRRRQAGAAGRLLLGRERARRGDARASTHRGAARSDAERGRRSGRRRRRRRARQRAQRAGGGVRAAAGGGRRQRARARPDRRERRHADARATAGACRRARGRTLVDGQVVGRVWSLRPLSQA